MSEIYSYKVADGHGLAHNPLKAVIAPRPIAWVSTVSADGTPNLAPYSFFNMVNDTPPMLAFCSNGAKDTIRNIQATGELVVNIPTVEFAEAMNATSGLFPSEVDEFDVAGLERASALMVAPALVKGAAAAIECVATEIVRLRDLERTELNSWLVVAQIVAVHLDSRFIVDGKFDTGKANPILRAGYADEYWAIDAHGKFSMFRPG